MTRRQQVQLVVVTVVGLLTLTVLLLFAFRVDYAELYVNMVASDAGEVKSLLDSKGVPTRIINQPDGKFTIQVPSSQVPALQAEMAGLIKQSVNILSVLSDTSVFTSEAERNYRVQYGTEGKLVTAYKTINGVRDADVTLNINRTPQTYGAPRSESSASIILTLEDGFTPDDEAVRGWVNLAARAVPNLPIENIALLDQNGYPLYDPNSPATTITATNKLVELESILARNFRRQLTEELGFVWGYNNVRVLVNVQLNNDSSLETKREYLPADPENPTSGFLISSESAWGNTGSEYIGGIPGTTADVPNVGSWNQQGAGEAGSYWYELENYDYSESYQEIALGPGSTRSISASVVVNSRVVPTTPEDILSYISLVRTFLGKNAEVAVVGIPFVDFSDPAAAEAAARRTLLLNVTYASLAVVALLAILIFLWRYLAARRRRLAEEDVEMMRMLATQQQVHLPDSQPSIQDKQRLQIMDELNRLALNRPEEFAKLVIAWMEEG
ncbi:MAG: flagellar M-ring protein FliF [Symbiobacteriaceae bacterium]|nr:flagellar M-ring protein FliF [Symbiobacteriaceae bacterium]